jgi:hypothetical protein
LLIAIVYPSRHHHHRHHHHQGTIYMGTVTLTVGHTAAFSLVFLDQNGNPMLTTPTPDAPPTWTDTTPATGTLTVAPSGLTASEVALAAGGDTVSVDLTVAGVDFKASIDVVVQAAPQVLTSVQIAATVS